MIASPTGSRSSAPMKFTYVPSRFSVTPSSEPADDGAERAVEPAEHGGGEGVEQDALHHVRLEEDDRRDHHPGDRAEHGREPPAEREHPARRGRRPGGSRPG